MTNPYLTKIPYALLYSRLVVAVLIIVFSFVQTPPSLIVALVVYAIISDIFDGIIARALHVSSPEMRREDTKIDTVFWFSCLFFICMKHSGFLKTQVLQVGILVFTEFFIIAIGYIKFHERISYHTFLSKLWALILLWFFIEMTLNGISTYGFNITFWYGLVVQTEIVIIAFILKTTHTDVPGLAHAFKLRKGKEIRKKCLF